MSFAAGLETPYYAVIFSSTMSGEQAEYAVTADRMEELARTMPGYLGIESARSGDGFGITVSYWRDEAAIAAWRRHSEHVLAQGRGRREWYDHYELRIARVERSYPGPGGR
jgi:heme-degrading monooxygenase HmoA